MPSKWLLAMVAWLGVAPGSHAAAAEAAQALPRVLELFEDDPEVSIVNADFQTALRSALATPVDLRTEHFDSNHLAGRAYRDALRQWLAIRYAGNPPEVIVALGEGAVGFLADAETNPWQGVPVVFARVDDRVLGVQDLPPDFTGVIDHYPVRETIELALQILPSTRRIALVGGASHADFVCADILRREVVRYQPRLEVVDLIGLSVPDLLEKVGGLPADSIAVVLSYYADASGRPWSTREVVRLVSELRTAPVFSVRAPVLGYGAMGGVMVDYDDTAQHAARLVERILAGERAHGIPAVRGGPYRMLLDGRELERWHVPDRRIPEAAEIRFREVGSWTRYLRQILFFSSALLVETVLIGALLIARRGRRKAERHARDNQAVIAHLNRVGAVGELTGSFAHELNTPLGAVLNNAQAARRFLAQGPARATEVLACLDDIVSDSCRAGEVVRRMRAVMRREEPRLTSVDVSAVIRDAVRLVEAEARDRDVSLTTSVDPRLPPVRGDDVQLVQVVLNLLMNALDALATMPPDRRRVTVQAIRGGGGLDIRVADTGPGISQAHRERVFEPFFTTKPRGLGLGLAITRSIVEAHGGRIRVLPVPGGGTAFHVFLPAMQIVEQRAEEASAHV